jgi:hypothetical protein
VAAAATDQLCRSFFDLWHHLDPVAAARFDPEAPPLALVGLDPAGVQQHLAAVRSLGFAVEELAVDELDDEIDRTLLLDALRTLERRFAGGGPYRADPAFWLHRLAVVLAERPDDPAASGAVPAILETARTALVRPGSASLGVALELFEPVRRLLAERPDAAVEDGFRARTALVEFDGFLRNDLAVDPDPSAGTLGAESVDWILRYELGLEGGVSPALRRILKRIESLEAEGRAVRDRPDSIEAVDALQAAIDRVGATARAGVLSDGEGFVRVRSLRDYERLVVPTAYLTQGGRGGALESAAPDLAIAGDRPDAAPGVAVRLGPTGAALALGARRSARSEVRRRYASPPWVGGFGLFAAESAGTDLDDAFRAAIRADRLELALIAAVDLGVHARQMTPAEGQTRLAQRLEGGAARARAAVGGILLHPLETAGAVLLWSEWDALAAGRSEPRAELVRRIAEGGILHPATAGWRLGAG